MSFERVFLYDTNCTEAQRELRLMSMRKGKDGKEEKKPARQDVQLRKVSCTRISGHFLPGVIDKIHPAQARIVKRDILPCTGACNANLFNVAP